MYYRLFVAVLFTGVLHTIADASGGLAVPFVDGRWYGSLDAGKSKSNFQECWASTTFDDGTTFKLIKRKDESWHLQLSNFSWLLPQSRRYAMEVLVDFYPPLSIAAEAKSQTLLEIAIFDHMSLLGFIENGHTIDLTSKEFNAKYELEGSAKVIQKMRACFTD